ncbi:NAD-dependent epimerase/dehydratase family protein [Falsibacillus pallidus]|uniref:2'-hydroxyisoflavone reductase n=1 Tax=Falsibacillus pallidus TaxID=493781 RepID=A0A370GHF3_9BACI|nr:NAD-dependent epimerase/dehydratase family protein [Falsibacillus pallidus]RDI43202.1 2'-hydroxyisoflavone reductase [Falsibacillus pallidus]
MKILIIGGTKFAGRAIVEEAVKKGFDVTLFNRGKTNDAIFPDLPLIKGDRQNKEDLAKLCSQKWDAVIDTCGYQPKDAALSSAMLKEFCSVYVFISTISVYKKAFQEEGIDEKSELNELSSKENEQLQKNGSLPADQYYGALKALCELAVTNELPSNSLIIRPGLIVGPHDPTDRFTYWMERVMKGGEMIAPDNKDCQIQFIDVRDLAQWILTLIEMDERGIWNAVGPTEPLTLNHFLNECRMYLNKETEITWAQEEFLLKNEVQPWIELPLWIPHIKDFGTEITKAKNAGLKTRQLKETILDTAEWASKREHSGRNAGLAADKEDALLKALNK